MISYSITKTAEPAIEPVGLSEAKEHLRITNSNDDSFINRLITSARQIAENFTGLGFIQQSYSMFIDEFPQEGVINIPKLPLLSVQAINIYDASDNFTAESLNSYSIDKIRGRIVLKDGYVAPISQRKLNGIEISFDVGYGANASDVPEDIKTAILLLVASMYENRGNNIAEQLHLSKTGAAEILQTYRIVKLG